MTPQKRKKWVGHGNKTENPLPHHLYEIIDKTDNSVYKYGISADEIDEDGYSLRLRNQVKIGNSFVDWLRFFGRILIRNIPGRKKAKVIENEFIEAYKDKTGEHPRGNFDRN